VFPEEVAEGVKAGDPDAIAAVYVALAERLLSYLMARVHDRATAEDLLESTFLELLQKGRTIRGGAASIKVWLFRSAHYNALDHLRRVARRGEELYDDPSRLESMDDSRGPEDLAIASDTTKRIRRALDQLSVDQRQVLLLRYAAGLSAPEIARVLGKNDGAIRSLQHRGERSLARLLKEQERGDDEGDPGVPVRPSRIVSTIRGRSA
jgi:RNA polymerase sigma-70 factor, ECF subfamily